MTFSDIWIRGCYFGKANKIIILNHHLSLLTIWNYRLFRGSNPVVPTIDIKGWGPRWRVGAFLWVRQWITRYMMREIEAIQETIRALGRELFPNSATHNFRRPNLRVSSVWGILPVAIAGTSHPRHVRTSSTVTTLPLDANTSSRYRKVVWTRVENTTRTASVSCPDSSSALINSFSISISSKINPLHISLFIA